MGLESTKSSKLLGLTKLKDKLLNLNPLYNRKIRFYISERLTWDLTELLSENDPKSVARFLSSGLSFLINNQENKKIFSLYLESFFKPLALEDITKIQKKVYHLQKKNLAVYQEKGYNELVKDIERDIYRQMLLEKKGWKIIRILSRDWSRNKEEEIERIKEKLNEHKKNNFSEERN